MLERFSSIQSRAEFLGSVEMSLKVSFLTVLLFNHHSCNYSHDTSNDKLMLNVYYSQLRNGSNITDTPNDAEALGSACRIPPIEIALST